MVVSHARSLERHGDSIMAGKEVTPRRRAPPQRGEPGRESNGHATDEGATNTQERRHEELIHPRRSGESSGSLSRPPHLGNLWSANLRYPRWDGRR